MFVFVIILGSITTLLHVYLTWRLGSLAWFAAPQAQRILWLTSLAIWLVYLAGIWLSHAPGGKLAFLLERLAMDWLGVLFIATCVLLALDLLTGFGLWAKPWLNLLRSGAVIVATVMIVVALIQGSRPPLVTRQEVTLSDLPTTLDGTRLVVLSDLHLGSQMGPRWLEKRVRQVEALQPDLVILLGDIFEGHGPVNGELQPLFQRLRAPLGVYAVTGNHEFFGDTEGAIAMSEKSGVVWLRNRWQAIAPGLSLAGVDDLSELHRRDKQVDRFGKLLAERPPGATLLLSHSPLQVERAASAGIDLMLSGHTHNGQIWPFNYLVKKFYPYLTGRYLVDGMTLIVSRGTGLWGPRMRLWQTGEIIEVTLHPAHSKD